MSSDEARSMPLVGKPGEASLLNDHAAGAAHALPASADVAAIADASCTAIDARSGPGTPFPPTYLFIIGFVLGWWINRFVPFPINGGRAVRIALGSAGVAIGAAFFWWGMATFYRIRTGIMLQRAATELVKSGPYRLSRNPMYVGLVAAYVGLSLLANMLWPLLLLPVVVMTLVVVVIAREERYLRTVFGRDYDEYCQQVGRWV